MQTEFVNRKKIHGNSWNMKNISKKKFMVFGVKRSITYIVDRKSLSITNSDLFRTFVLGLNGQVIEIGCETIRSA